MNLSFVKRKSVFLFLILLISLFSNIINAQSLLWKISGNGLQKPSYLYGTMHLKSLKVFEIGDSAIIALKNVDAFATECYLDSIIYLFKTKNDVTSYTPYINYDSIFTKEEIALINKKLQKSNSKNLDYYKKLQFNFLLDALIESDGKKKETFLDAWLFYVAKTLNKQLYGLEDINSTSNLVKDIIDSIKVKEQILERVSPKFDSLFDYYYSQNLEKLNKLFINSLQKNGNDKVVEKWLYSRNKLMVENMINIIHKQSLFTAVGVAHLSGEYGIIDLLRSKGYTVEPVEKKVTKISKNFKVDGSNLKWLNYKNQNYFYNFDIPIYPIDSPNFNFGLKSSFDFGTGIEYGVMVFDRPPNIDTKDKIFLGIDALITNIKIKFENVQEISRKKIDNNDLLGYEISMIVNNTYLKYLVYSKFNYYYIFLCSTDHENRDHKDINRFFKSIKFDSTLKNDIARFYSQKNDFSVNLPGTPEETSQTIDDPNNYFASFDYYYKIIPNSPDQYIMISYNYKPGFYLQANEITENILQNYIKGNATLKNCDPQFSYQRIENIDCKIVSLISKEYKLQYKMAIIPTPEKIFIIMMQSELSNNTDKLDNFINSFKFEYKPLLLVPDTVNNFIMKLPEKYIPQTTFSLDSNDKLRNYFKNAGFATISNSQNKSLYNFMSANINDYYHAENDSLYLLNELEYFQNQNDTLISYKFYKEFGIPKMEFEFQNKEIQSIQTKGIISINGQNEIIFWIISTENYFVNSNYKEVYHSIKPLKIETKWQISANKKEILLNDLLTNDSTKIKLIKKIFPTIEFTDNDKNSLISLLYKSFYDKNLDNSIKSMIISTLSDLININDYEKLRNDFAQISNNSKEELALLELLANQNTIESYNFLIDKLLKLNLSDLSHDNFNLLFYYFRNHTDLIKNQSSNLFSLFQNSNLKDHIVDLANYALSNEDWNSKSISKFENQIESYFNSYIEQYLNYDQSDTSNNFNFYNLYNIMKLNNFVSSTNNSVPIFHKLKNDSNFLIKMYSIIGLLKFNETLSDSILHKQANDLFTRIDFYDGLKALGLLDKFPKNFKNQISLGESDLYNYLMNNDFVVDTIIYVDEMIKLINGEKMRYLIYKVINEDEDSAIVGWTGPYPLIEDQNKLTTYADHTSSKYDEYSRINVERNFDKWIEELLNDNK